jgi:hypothetical protein
MKPVIIDPAAKMNKTEKDYADLLYLQKLADEIWDYRFEEIKFKLADNTFYTPDFFITYPLRFEVHEVKGGYKNKQGLIVPYYKDDAIVKLKVAAKQFSWFKWKIAYQYQKTWYYKEI